MNAVCLELTKLENKMKILDLIQPGYIIFLLWLPLFRSSQRSTLKCGNLHNPFLPTLVYTF